MQTINYIVYSDHLGDNTDRMTDDYIAAVQQALETDYPDTSVNVELHNGSGCYNGYATGFEDDEAVTEDCHQTANNIWDRADY